MTTTGESGQSRSVVTRKPFTLRERKRWSQDFGHRYVNNWGGGDLPAPFCAGDVVELVGPMPYPDEDEGYDRLRAMVGPFFVVTYGPSIDDGDAWYFRVADGTKDHGSDRLHVAYADRSTWPEDVDWMSSFRLVETIDPVGLALRKRMLANGWSFNDPPRCPTCGSRTFSEVDE